MSDLKTNIAECFKKCNKLEAEITELKRQHNHLINNFRQMLKAIEMKVMTVEEIDDVLKGMSK